MIPIEDFTDVFAVFVYFVFARFMYENVIFDILKKIFLFSKNTLSENILIMVIITIVMVIMVIRVIRVASVKSSKGILTHQGHISKVNEKAQLLSQ